MKDISVLLVDDDQYLLSSIGTALEGEGYAVATAENGETALEMLSRRHFDLVITDLIMGRTSGLDVLDTVKTSFPATMVMVLTGFGEVSTVVDILRSQGDEFILKSHEPELILRRISICLHRLELKRKIKTYEKILPICCVCKRIREEDGGPPDRQRWLPLEEFILKRGLSASHTYCPECAEQAMADLPSGGFKPTGSAGDGDAEGGGSAGGKPKPKGP